MFCDDRVAMQKWEYRVFASHLDPVELVIILDQSGKEGWELVSVVGVIDAHPRELIHPEVSGEEAEELVELEAFRYIFKRPTT
jgi:hypothetical protein